MEQKHILKNSIVEYMKRLCECGLTTSLGGNISCRIDNGMLITPSSIDKKQLKDSDIIEMDFLDNVIEGLHKPSIEHRIHSSIYKTRLDIQGKRIIKKSLTFVSKKSWSPSIILPNYRIHV